MGTVNYLDVTVDTNVLVHANNNNDIHFASSRKFLSELRRSNAVICLDEGFDIDESKNKSQIGSEYFDNVRSLSFSFAILISILTADRTHIVSKRECTKFKRKLLQFVANKKDRIFAAVALASNDKLLVSNDKKDFNKKTKNTVKKKFKLRILTTKEVIL